MRLPPVVRTFLRDHDFSEKTIILFNTHAGLDKGKSVSEIKEFAPKAKVLEGFSINGINVKNSQAEMEKWIEQISD